MTSSNKHRRLPCRTVTLPGLSGRRWPEHPRILPDNHLLLFIINRSHLPGSRWVLRPVRRATLDTMNHSMPVNERRHDAGQLLWRTGGLPTPHPGGVGPRRARGHGVEMPEGALSETGLKPSGQHCLNRRHNPARRAWQRQDNRHLVRATRHR